MCAPLIFIDKVYSIDATHFIQEHFLPYRKLYPEAYTVNKAGGKKYVNLHALVGANTLLVASAIPAHRNRAERDQFRPLVEKLIKFREDAAKNRFPGIPEDVKREVEGQLGGEPLKILGDKGYTGRKVKQVAEELGVILIVTEKKNSRNKQTQVEETQSEAMRRNTIETAFNMVKEKMRRRLHSKNETSAFNEVLGKVVCHNLIEIHRYQVATGEKIAFL